MMRAIAEQAERDREALLLTVNDVGRALRCSGRHVWALNAAGKMPAPVRVGRAVRWRRSCIAMWIELGCPDRATFEAARGEGVAS